MRWRAPFWSPYVYRTTPIYVEFTSDCAALLIDVNDGRVFLSDIASLTSEQLVERDAKLLGLIRSPGVEP